MCCSGKCLFFIPVRTGALIFGYILAVISALGTIASTVANMYYGIIVMFPYGVGPWWKGMGSPGFNITAVLLVEFLSSFVCVVLLLVGITQNKPKLVKIFLIYGQVQIVLHIIFIIMVECMFSYIYNSILYLGIGLMGIYAMCLYMVFKAYQSMDEGQVYGNPPVNTGQEVDSKVKSFYSLEYKQKNLLTVS